MGMMNIKVLDGLATTEHTGELKKKKKRQAQGFNSSASVKVIEP